MILQTLFVARHVKKFTEQHLGFFYIFQNLKLYRDKNLSGEMKDSESWDRSHDDVGDRLPQHVSEQSVWQTDIWAQSHVSFGQNQSQNKSCHQELWCCSIWGFETLWLWLRYFHIIRITTGWGGSWHLNNTCKNGVYSNMKRQQVL